MRSIFVLLILVMIGLNGKGQSVTALPDSVLSQCCLEVTLLNGNVTTVDWVFIQYITRDGTGTKLFVEYAPNFGGIQWETQIRIQDDFDDVLERSKFIVIPFTVGTTDYGINRNWIANIEENATTGGTWIYGRFGSPKRKFSAVEDYETMKNLLLACRPRAIVVAENGLYTEGDTVRMGGFLIENTTITTEGYNWVMKDTLSKTEFGLDYSSVFGDTVSYMARRWGKWRNTMHVGRRYFMSYSLDTTGVTGIESAIEHSYFAGTDDPYVKISTQSGSGSTLILNRFQVDNYQGSWSYEDNNTNPYYTNGVLLTSTTAQLGSGESGTGDPGNGVAIGTYGFGIGADEYVFLRTKGIDNSTATVGQFLQLQNASTGKSEWATIDLSAYLPIADTAAMLDPYIQGAGTINRVPIFTGSRVIGNSNIQDNNTSVSILNSKPFQLGQWTTAGRPTGVNGYAGFNTSFNWPEWYSSTGWFSPARAVTTGGAFTATHVPFGGTGGLTQSSKITFDEPNSVLTLNSSYLLIQGPPTGITSGIRMTSSNTASLAYLSVTMQPSNGATTQFFSTNNAYPGYQVITNNAFGLYHSGAGGMGIQSDNAASSVRFGIGTSGTVEKMRVDVNGVGVFTTPTQELDVNGDLRVRDSLRLPILSSILQTEASGWVKALTIGGGLAYSGGILRSNIDTTSYIKGLGTIGTIPIFSGARIISDSKMVYTSGTKQIKYTGADFFVEDSIIGGVTTQVKNKAQGTNVTTGLVAYNQSDEYAIFGMSSNGYNTISEVGGNRGYIYTEARRGFVIKSLIDSSEIVIKVGGAQGIEVKMDTMEFSLNKRVRFSKYGTPATTAAALSKTLTNYGVGFATDGTVTSREIKRDTTIYVIDADYDFSAALTTAQVASRYNRVIFLMTTTAAAGSDSELTLHTPDINLMQCEYLVRSTDEAGGFSNVIRFGSNNAVDSTNGLASSYFPAAGQGVGIRAGLRSGVYKYLYY